MSRPNPLALFAVLAAFAGVLAGLSLMKGALLIGRHEGDMLHLMDILFRMERGEMPHADFVTPIGAFAFVPTVAFLRTGMGVDQAILWAQAAVAAGLLPAVWYVAWSRFRGAVAYVFGLSAMALIVALVHGEAVESVSISMQYNRWAWALAYVAVPLALLPSTGRPAAGLDGALIGVAGAALVMTKVTYAVPILPVLAIALVARGEMRAIFAAGVAGLAVLAGVTLWGGLGFWGAYIGDLLTVAGSEVRPFPGLSWDRILVAPAYFGISVAALSAVIVLRQSGAAQGGLFLLLLLPGFVYITYQNFANDPQWLVLAACLILAFRDETDAGEGASLLPLAVALLAFATPSVVNLAYSPIRHFNEASDDYAPILPEVARHAGFRTANVRANRVNAQVPLDLPGGGLEAYRDAAERDDPVVFLGERLPECEIMLGLPAWFQAMTDDLEGAGLLDGRRIFTADILSPFWLYGSAEALPGGAPWYYGGLPGFDNADLLIVPLCPIAPPIRAQILEALEELGPTLAEVRRTPLYVAFSIG